MAFFFLRCVRVSMLGLDFPQGPNVSGLRSVCCQGVCTVIVAVVCLLFKIDQGNYYFLKVKLVLLLLLCCCYCSKF